jgi:hypothetical protein
MEFVPDIQRLSAIFGMATAPAFFLGAIAAFVSLMLSRMSATIDRIRAINSISDIETEKLKLRTDVGRLVRRVNYLHDGIRMALCAGISATALLGIIFVSEFFGFKYAYGAGILFATSTVLLGFALLRFAQEIWIGLSDYDQLAH